MSKVISLVGAQTAVNVKIQQAVAFLIFHCSFPDASAASWAALLTRMNAIKVSVDLQSKKVGVLPMIPKVPLGVLAQICARQGGQIDVEDNGTDMSVRFKYLVGNGGSLQLSDESLMVIDITGMVVGDNVDVYAGDLPIGTTVAEVIGTLRLNANAAASVNLLNAHTLHLPVASFDKLEITFRGGKVVSLLPEEIKAWLLEGNEMQGNLLGVVTNGFMEWYSVNVTDAVSAKITLTGDANAYIGTIAAAI